MDYIEHLESCPDADSFRNNSAVGNLAIYFNQLTSAKSLDTGQQSEQSESDKSQWRNYRRLARDSDSAIRAQRNRPRRKDPRQVSHRILPTMKPDAEQSDDDS